MFRRVLCFAILTVFGPPAYGRPIDLYVLAGQSNMFGQGLWSQVPLADRDIPNGTLYYRPERDGGYGAIRPIGGKFGPEVTFAQTIDKPIAVVKHAVGSTRLAVEWHPETGYLLPELFTAVDEAIATWTLQGYEPRLKGFLWMQGEHDAKSSWAAAQYADNFTRFIGRVRDHFDAPQLPFVFGRISVPTHPYRDMVRDAQQTVANAVPGVTMIDTDGVHLSDDLVHYDSAGQIQLGRLFGREFVRDLPGHDVIVIDRGGILINGHGDAISHQELPSGQPQSVPEPTTILLATVLGPMCLSCFRRSSRYCRSRRT